MKILGPITVIISNLFMLIINLNINPGLRAEKTIVLMLYEYLFVL